MCVTQVLLGGCELNAAHSCDIVAAPQNGQEMCSFTLDVTLINFPVHLEQKACPLSGFVSELVKVYVCVGVLLAITVISGSKVGITGFSLQHHFSGEGRHSTCENP